MEDPLLTNIITTSPCFFNPDTTMISSVLKSLIPMGILKYKTFITCDGYIVKDNHQLKCGVVTKDMIEKYEKFIENLEKLIVTDEDLKQYSNNIKILRFNQRFGFAYAVKHAIESQKITTKYIMIIQHDWIFTDPTILIDDFISKMEKLPDVNYIAFVSDSTEKYMPYIKCQFTTDNNRRRIISEHKDCFHPQDESLVKLNFWYDRNHIARLDYYMNKVFTVINEKDNKPLVRNFFEDTFGHYEMTKIKENGLDAHKDFGSYIYYPILPNTNEYSKIVVVHLNGRKYLPKEERDRLVVVCKIMNAYWKEDFPMPKSFQYTFKKITFDNIALCDKLAEFDKTVEEVEKKDLSTLMNFLKSADEGFHKSLVEIYEEEKKNFLEGNN